MSTITNILRVMTFVCAIISAFCCPAYCYLGNYRDAIGFAICAIFHAVLFCVFTELRKFELDA
jgi:hypothetical protein